MININKINYELNKLKRTRELLISKLNETNFEIQKIQTKIIELEFKIELGKKIVLQKTLNNGETAKQKTDFLLINEFNIVTKKSTTKEKYDLFISLFEGRLDVHAKRFQSIKTGKSGYSPVCENEFNRNYCTKGISGEKRIKCIDCANQNFLSISIGEFEEHIRGISDICKDVLGAYPVDKDEMCKFIVCDFDNHSSENVTKQDEIERFEKTKEESLAYSQECTEHNIPAYLEISRSGKGIHVWIFFKKRISAKKARNLCSSILTIAMSKHSVLTFKSYDRFIPNQDTLPKSGFGNLIALPLQGRAGVHQGSIFVDENMIVYKDQWEFLSTIKKLTEEEIDKILSEIGETEELGELLPNIENQSIKPWEKKKSELPLEHADIQGVVKIVQANMIHIEKEKLSAKAVNKIRRIGEKLLNIKCVF